MANPWDNDPIDTSNPWDNDPIDTSNPWDNDPVDSPAIKPKLLGLQDAKISASRRPNSFLEAAEQWLGNAGDDIREGSDSTIVGKGLKALGAKGTSYGTPKAVGDYMASPIQGPLRVAKGMAQIPQGKVADGAGNVVMGALDAVQIPGAFMGGSGVSATANKIDAVIPSSQRAGENFQKVMRGAGTIPINTAEAGDIALRAKEMGDRGATVPKVISRFVKAATDPGATPITYEVGRDFASNAGRLSAQERMKANPAMSRQVAMLAKSLNTANEAAAEQAGLGEVYRAAMKEYRQAQQMKEAATTVGKGALAAIGGGAALTIAKKLLDPLGIFH